MCWHLDTQKSLRNRQGGTRIFTSAEGRFSTQYNAALWLRCVALVPTDETIFIARLLFFYSVDLYEFASYLYISNNNRGKVAWRTAHLKG